MLRGDLICRDVDDFSKAGCLIRVQGDSVLVHDHRTKKRYAIPVDRCRMLSFDELVLYCDSKDERPTPEEIRKRSLEVQSTWRDENLQRTCQHPFD